MHAIMVEDDDARTLTWTQIERPAPGPHEILVEVKAAGLNRADLVQRQGHYPPPPGASSILGLEAAGVVTACGDQVTRWTPGDRVCALLTGGGYAEYVTCPASMALPIPSGVDFATAAAWPEVFATAWVNLFMEAQAQPGEWAMIHAGGSGVGTAALQLCREMGIQTIATASATKLARLRELGCEVTVDRHEQDFLEVVREATQGRGVDVILDPVGANYLEKNILALASRGRLVVIGLMGGAFGEVPLGRLLVKRLRILGSVLRSRSLEEKEPILAALEAEVLPKLATGAIETLIHARFPMADAEAAHAMLASNQTVGKVILEVK